MYFEGSARVWRQCMCRCGLGGGLDFHDAEAAVRAVLIANSLHSCAARAAPQRDAHAAAPSKSNAARDSRGTRARKRAHTHATRARTQTQPTFVSPMQCVVLINTELLLVSQCPRKTDGAALLLQRARPAAPASDVRACALKNTNTNTITKYTCDTGPGQTRRSARRGCGARAGCPWAGS